MLPFCFNRILFFSLWAICLWFVPLVSLGQNLNVPYRTIRVEDGLASDVVYHAMQDSKGFIWISTETGVSRFNGVEFENFTTSDGLGDNDIFQTFEDTQGRIWFASFNGHVSFYHNGAFHNAQNDSTIARMENLAHSKFSLGYMAAITEGPDSCLWFSFRWGAIIQLKPDGTCKTFLQEAMALSRISPSRLIYPYPNGEVLVLTPAESFTLTNDGREIVHYVYGKPENAFDKGFILNEDSIILLSNSHWIVIDPQAPGKPPVYHSHSWGGLYFVRFAKGEIWGANTLGLLPIERTAEGFVEGDPIFHDEKVSWSLKDSEGNVWVCTLGSGIFFVPTFKVFRQSNFRSPQSITVSSLDYFNETGIMVGMDQFWFGQIKDGNFISRQIVKQKQTFRGRTKEFFRDLRGDIWIVNENYLARLHDGELQSSVLSVRSMTQDPNTQDYLMITASGQYRFPPYMADYIFTEDIRKLEGGKTYSILKPFIFTFEAATKIFRDSNNRFWLGGGSGLFEVLPDTIRRVPLRDDLMGRAVSTIMEDREMNLWVGISGFGALRISPDGSQTLFSQDDGLSSNFIRNIYADDENRIYLATNTGVNLLQFDPLGIVRISKMTMRDGLASDDTYDVLRMGDTIYVGTSKGLNFFHLEELFHSQRETPPLLVRIADSGLDWQQHISDINLSPNQKLTIEFASLSFRFAESMNYRYKIVGIDTTWQQAQTNRLEFPVLPAGNYTLLLQASFSDSDWPEKYASVEFSVLAPIWKQVWFWLAIAVVVIGIVAGFVLWRVSLQRDRQRLLQKAAENRQTALRSQMNPHFIFNSLNSLQRFILQNNTEAAYDYTTKFGRLVRAVLENSMHATVTLRREIETLTLYLELESIRFDHRFNYTISVDPLLNQDKIAVPPTLIQPFVENAIWHGLMPSEQEGTVSISVRKAGELMHFTIQDNGIGFEQSAQITKNKSRMGIASGIKITEERIQAKFKGKLEGPFVIISDVLENGKVAGTKVEFEIPFSTLS